MKIVYGLAWLLFAAPFKKLVADAVREVIVEFALDDPRAGGRFICCKCDTETLHGICPSCQPMTYARLA